MNPQRAIAYRKQAAALFEALLENTITPRAALNSWPMEGNRDPSVQCAYTILWFFEADSEERHQKELFYADLQIKLLMDIATQLKTGSPLPAKLLHEYKVQLAPSQYTDKSTLKMGLIRWTLAAWKTAQHALAPLISSLQGLKK